MSRQCRHIAVTVQPSASADTATAGPSTSSVSRLYANRLRHEVARTRLPGHVAVILDGNRRWASLLGLREPSAGHRAGADKLDELLDWCARLGIEQVTVWALSNEHLARPTHELAALLEVVADKLQALATLHHAQSMRIRVCGCLEVYTSACGGRSARWRRRRRGTTAWGSLLPPATAAATSSSTRVAPLIRRLAAKSPVVSKKY
jgi:Putative undecaprenyl diphosphate synthase